MRLKAHAPPSAVERSEGTEANHLPGASMAATRGAGEPKVSAGKGRRGRELSRDIGNESGSNGAIPKMMPAGWAALTTRTTQVRLVEVGGGRKRVIQHASENFFEPVRPTQPPEAVQREGMPAARDLRPPQTL